MKLIKLSLVNDLNLTLVREKAFLLVCFSLFYVHFNSFVQYES